MRINWKLVSGILAAVIIHDTWAAHKNQKYVAKLLAERTEALELSNLHASMLRKNKIHYDEFEKIVASQLLQDYKLPK